MSADYDNYYGDETRPLKDENQPSGPRESKVSELKALEWKIKALAVSVAVLFMCFLGTLIFSIVQESNNEEAKSDLEIRLQELTQKGVWCGYKDQLSANADWTTITYDKLLLSSTNINDPGIGIDIESGKDV